MFTLKDLRNRLSGNDPKQVQFNRKILFAGMMILIVIGFIYGFSKAWDDAGEVYVTLYYSDSDHRLLIPVRHPISSKISEDEKIRHTVSLLIQGPRSPKLKPLITPKTQLTASWLINNELHIHLSRDFLNLENKDILDERLITQSIVASIFKSFSIVDKIRIHVGNGFQKTIFGAARFDSFYHRESYRIDSLYEN